MFANLETYKKEYVDPLEEDLRNYNPVKMAAIFNN